MHFRTSLGLVAALAAVVGGLAGTGALSTSASRVSASSSGIASGSRTVAQQSGRLELPPLQFPARFGAASYKGPLESASDLTSSRFPTTQQAPQECLIAYFRYGGCYDYAGATQTVNNQGASVSFPVSDAVLAGRGHTLIELAVFNRTPAGVDTDTAEIGWIVSRTTANSPPNPTLFIAKNTETCEPNTSCGFVSTSNTITEGMTLKPGNYTWAIRQVDGNWEFLLNGTEFGYIPASAYSDGFPQATMVNVYGEIEGSAKQPAAPACTQMGSGQFGTQRGADTISNFQLYGASSAPDLVPYLPTDSSAWSITDTPNTFSVGGPGNCKPVAGTVPTSDGGYTVVGQDTTAYPFPDGQNPWFLPSTPYTPSVANAGPIVAVAPDAATGGYWMTDAQGDVYAVNAPSYDGIEGTGITAPIVGITPFGSGYLLVTAGGSVYGFNTSTYGGLRNAPRSPVVGIAATADGDGYLIATADGTVYKVSQSHSSTAAGTGSVRVVAKVPGASGDNRITGIASSGGGFLLVSETGRVYSFGGAPYYGSLSSGQTSMPVIGITPTATGYVLTNSIGDVYAFNTPFNGSVTHEGV